jgi:hypothetical protein
MITERHAEIEDLVSRHQNRVEETLALLARDPGAIPGFADHVTDEFALRECDAEGGEACLHLDPARILRAKVDHYLSSDQRFSGCRFAAVRTNLPMELRTAFVDGAPVLLSRMMWLEATIEVTHPALDLFWDEVAVAVRAAAEASGGAGGRRLLSPGKPDEAWRGHFCRAFIPDITARTGRPASEFRMRLEIGKRHGVWFPFDE